ncbi:protein MEMO1-like [Lineus longissimus]|uniref:protein MEMO1-like n=1 Tax=Lineus longissimus TaxID=88925 RepID=UPI00315CAE91
MSKYRKASHAGSWYLSSKSDLKKQLNTWLANASVDAETYPARAIIAPHAGYAYCGECGGYAYRQVDPSRVKRVFILGPSHFVRMDYCALSSAEVYQNPIMDLEIDQKIYDELKATGRFETMKLHVDEEEHSIEMHLPYIAKIMERPPDQKQVTIVPVLVGALPPEKEVEYGQIFAKYLADPENLFVISSDFCHWGKRFRYIHYDKSHGPIHKFIHKLDKQGMDTISKLEPHAFSEYLKTTQNTICGRYPICVLLNAIKSFRSSINGNGCRMQMRFIKYVQSGQCTDVEEHSSVSYAAGAFVVRQ